MSRWRTETHALHIGALSVHLDGTLLAAAGGHWPQLAEELARLLPARGRIHVTVADVWVRYFLLHRPIGVDSLRDARLLLQARFEALYGASSADWLLQADWQLDGAMLACALPRALAQVVEPFQLAHVQPAALQAWNRAARRLGADGAWCTAADGQLNLLVWHAGELAVVGQQRGTDADALLALELARLDLPAPAAKLWSGAAAPSGWQLLEAGA